ncbi:MAG: ATP-dependent Clp protease ATP-binding subunit [Candidatus Magasanikbacteria bacterium]|nr:ATP-dependent Clp protease ATP-binding subunit [Candidatus Magasanikbacteria bacterium]
MLFEKQPSLPLLVCATCRGVGQLRFRRCPECRGLAAVYAPRGRLLFWHYPLERYHLALVGARRVFNIVRLIIVAVVGANFWFWAAMIFYRRLGVLANVSVSSLASALRKSDDVSVLFWLGLLTLLYLVSRLIRERQHPAVVEPYHYGKEREEKRLAAESWSAARRVPSRRRLNIALTFTDEARAALGAAYRLADRYTYNQVTALHLIYALLSFNRISNIFIRLGIPARSLAEALKPLLSRRTTTTGGRHTAPIAGEEFFQILFAAYEEAYAARQDYVSVTELLVAAIKASSEIQEILYDLNVVKQRLLNVVEWARIRERLWRQYREFRKVARRRSAKGMDRAMTAVATPYLNQFSEDLTLLAQFGHTEPCIAREREIEEIFRVVEGGQQSVLLVGDYGTGKRSVIEGIAELMVAGKVPGRLRDKRLVRLSISTLLSGTTPAGAVERLIRIMNEIARARNIILFIHNLHELVGVSAGGKQSLDVAGTLGEYLSGGRWLTLATTSTEAYAQLIAHTQLGTVFTKVEIPEMDENQAIRVLESKVGYVEHKHQVFFSYDAIERAATLARKFLRDVTLPGSALELMTEAASFTRSQKGANSLVAGEAVAAVVAQKTGIPVTSVGADETAKLLDLERELHRRVVGQDEAVTLVANALRRARAEIRSTSRPIANFLFLGPTGVGKTELAKTIAAVYFGGEERMIRLDMSEYQDKSSIYRLIGAPGEKGTGILTEAVRARPFALLLLDEIEKADKDVLNLFLQVMDDGRLTDSSGRAVDFTNVILIATSNAGTQYVLEQLRQGVATEAIKEKLLHGELAQYFRPEWLNRFDGIVLFKSLSREDIRQVAGLMLKRLARDLETKGIELVVTDAALDFLSEVGWDPEFGARPMRRALQEKVENEIAALLLAGKLKRRDTVELGAGGKIAVQ